MRLVTAALLGLLGLGCAGPSQGPSPRMNPPTPTFDPALVLPIVKWPADQPRPLLPADPAVAAQQAAQQPAARDVAGPGSPTGQVLRQLATAWTAADGDIQPLLDRMQATLLHSGGVGIAAPQVGVARRVFLVKHGTRPPGQLTRIVAYINPQVVWASPEMVEDYEACLSVSGVGGQLPRAQALRVRYQAADDLGGPPREVEASGWDARIFQHELDHIDGRLYIDHVAQHGRSLLPIDEMRRQRDAIHRQRGLLP